MVLASSLSNLIRAERISSALQMRTIGRARAFPGAVWRTIFIESGQAELEMPESTLPIHGPSLSWVPWDEDVRLRLGAGTVGAYVTIARSSLASAIGHRPESPELRYFSEYVSHVQLADKKALTEIVKQCFEGILRETTIDTPTSVTVIEALLRILLIGLWREQVGQEMGQVTGSQSQRLVNRFENLVEAQFRNRLTIAEYAGSLGISTDRLTDICQRHRSMTPGEIVRRRTNHEAIQLLVNSTYAIDQIADILGFSSAAHFIRFFKTGIGMTPGKYRRETQIGDSPKPDDQSRLIFEWP